MAHEILHGASPEATGRRDQRGGEAARRIGEVVGGAGSGATVVLVGGIHGNESAGVPAIEEVLEGLRQRTSLIRGRIVGLRGNRAALARGVRFVRRDLNRLWNVETLDRLREAAPATLKDEDKEQRELHEEIDAAERTSSRPLLVIDLHTTSGRSTPFVCFSDTLVNRRLARSLPVTAVLGLEEIIEGSLLGFCADRGHAAIAFEGGGHEDPETVRRHVAAVWLMLLASGAVTAAAVPDVDRLRGCLAAAAASAPRIVEVRYRHVVRPDDEFTMSPGLRSFEPVREGQLVARDRHGDVRVPVQGRMLMPRYQGQGEDGYFVVRDVAPIWLGLSSLLRRTPAFRLLRALPGVRRDGERLLVDAHITPAGAIAVMHLFGFRRRPDEGRELVFARRDV